MADHDSTPDPQPEPRLTMSNVQLSIRGADGQWIPLGGPTTAELNLDRWQPRCIDEDRWRREYQGSWEMVQDPGEDAARAAVIAQLQQEFGLSVTEANAYIDRAQSIARAKSQRFLEAPDAD